LGHDGRHWCFNTLSVTRSSRTRDLDSFVRFVPEGSEVGDVPSTAFFPSIRLTIMVLELILQRKIIIRRVVTARFRIALQDASCSLRVCLPVVDVGGTRQKHDDTNEREIWSSIPNNLDSSLHFTSLTTRTKTFGNITWNQTLTLP
jgi:hypothetical protein